MDQIATWVGLGWSLNAGGACTVNCIDDKHGNFESRLIDTMTEKEIEEYMENFGFSNPNQGMLLESWIDNQTIPDICSYNFLGYSGRFFLFNGKAHELYGSKQLIFTNIYPNFAHILSAKDLRGIDMSLVKGHSLLLTQYSILAKIFFNIVGNIKVSLLLILLIPLKKEFVLIV